MSRVLRPFFSLTRSIGITPLQRPPPAWQQSRTDIQRNSSVIFSRRETKKIFNYIPGSSKEINRIGTNKTHSCLIHPPIPLVFLCIDKRTRSSARERKDERARERENMLLVQINMVIKLQCVGIQNVPQTDVTSND